MKYERIRPAVFLSRPNRFIANIDIDGQVEVCHVKNTGRCRELLISGCRVYVQLSENSKRKTKYDLIAVEKGRRLINIDSYAPNIVFGEFLSSDGLGFRCDSIRPETVHGDSRFDFFFEHDGKRCFAEVKGVTLEENNVLRFPDAPTLRGLKHLRGLSQALKDGFEAYCVFIIQMSRADYFEPNRQTHPEFAEALIEAQKAGVKLLAYECDVAPDEISISKQVKIKL